MKIAEALEQARTEAGWSVTKLAAEAGVTEAAARRWTTGDAMPAGDIVVKLQRLLPRFAELLRLDGAA